MNEGVVLCYGEEDPGYLATFGRRDTLSFSEQAFSILPSDFEIIPRDPETYKDWQVGDKMEIRASSRCREVIFRCGEVVICKDKDDGRASLPFTCEELFEDEDCRLILTDIEQQIIEERKKAEDNPIKNPKAVQILAVINKLLDGYTPKGQLEGFPPEVIAKMMERQYEQTGKVKIEVFEKERFSLKEEGGFDWNHTPEGNDFWRGVLAFGDLSEFFRRYPHEEKCPFKKFDAVLVRDSNDNRWTPAIFDHFDLSVSHRFRTADGAGYKQCAPFNENTEKYLGSAQEIPDRQEE